MPYQIPRCQIVPLPDERVSLQIDGAERLRWHADRELPRPFFFPLLGPSGSVLTRMGHPGASNHGHHRSIWFAHHKVLGMNFWTDSTGPRIRQKQWLAYSSGDDEALMAVRLGWYDGHNPKELIDQELVAVVRPGEGGETFVELQSTFRPTAASLEFGKTNFGFLAVRVAESLSAYFGGGQLTNSEGRKGEKNVFGRRAQWMDYSGPVRVAESAGGAAAAKTVVEGITYFDHPSNPTYPSRWHVREDGWMGASVCMDNAIETTREHPLVLRYLLHAHSGNVAEKRADEISRQFAASSGYSVQRAKARHTEFVIRRVAAARK